MSNKRRVEVFTSGCYVCGDVVQQVKDLACDNCEVIVYDLNKGCETDECKDKVEQYVIRSVPAVAIDGMLVNCCSNSGVNFDALRAAGLGN
jgi:alkyl hydroperoxide reductase subunit AhpF